TYYLCPIRRYNDCTAAATAGKFQTPSTGETIMAHEIQSHDNVVLHKTAAWHGLGVVVQDAPTPKEALKIAGLDWEVQQWPCSATDGESRIALHNTVANVRSDTKQSLGIVKTVYQPIQNADLADFCELLAKEGDAVK